MFVGIFALAIFIYFILVFCEKKSSFTTVITVLGTTFVECFTQKVFLSFDEEKAIKKIIDKNDKYKEYKKEINDKYIN